MPTSDDSFSQNFARTLRISSKDGNTDDPNYLIRSASAPPSRHEFQGDESVNFLYNTQAKGNPNANAKSHANFDANTQHQMFANGSVQHPIYSTYGHSPHLHSINGAGAGAVSGGLFPMSNVHSSPRLYAQNTSHEPFGSSFMLGPDGGNYPPNSYDYFQNFSGANPTHHSPVLAPIPSPYSHPLLPQSLLGASGIGTPPSSNAMKPANGSTYFQQFSPVLGPSHHTEYYAGQFYDQGFLSQHHGEVQMPLMAQLPPAAAQFSTDAPISRYLREASHDAEKAAKGTSGASGASGTVLESQWSAVAGDSSKKGDVEKTVPDKPASPPTGSSLLEELRAKMKQQHVAPSTNVGGRHRHHSSPDAFSSQSAGALNFYPANAGKGSKNANQSSGVSWGLGAIKGHVCEFAKDQHGSRFIQQQLESSMVSAADKQSLFEEVLPFSRMLCTDVFGNYVIQKLLDPAVGTPGQQEQLCLTAIQGNMVELSMHMYGCRVVQKLVEKIFGEDGNDTCARYAQPPLKGTPGSRLYDPAFQDSLLEELSPHIVKCVQDQNGNHVVQKCIEQIRPINRIMFILNAFKGNICLMARHPYGCRVVQRVLENCDEQTVSASLAELISQIQLLVQDQYGNYVIQHIIEGSRDRHPEERKRLIQAVQDNVLSFSMHKFASNVVEKCLQHGDADERREIINRTLEPAPGSTDRRSCPLQLMMKDPYANYVVQKVMDMAEPEQREQVVVLVKENAAALRKLTYGKHILARLDKLGNEGGGYQGNHKGRRQTLGHHSG